VIVIEIIVLPVVPMIISLPLFIFYIVYLFIDWRTKTCRMISSAHFTKHDWLVVFELLDIRAPNVVALKCDLDCC